MSSAEVVIVAILGVYTIVSAVLNLDPRMVAIVGLVLLVEGAISLARSNEALADKIAAVGFCFLASGAVLFLVQHIRGRERD
jgi:hypothetical protein